MPQAHACPNTCCYTQLGLAPTELVSALSHRARAIVECTGTPAAGRAQSLLASLLSAHRVARRCDSSGGSPTSWHAPRADVQPAKFRQDVWAVLASATVLGAEFWASLAPQDMPLESWVRMFALCAQQRLPWPAGNVVWDHHVADVAALPPHLRLELLHALTLCAPRQVVSVTSLPCGLYFAQLPC